MANPDKYERFIENGEGIEIVSTEEKSKDELPEPDLTAMARGASENGDVVE